VATYFAVEGIKKLRALGVKADKMPLLWRGMRNMKSTELFNKEGGTEMAFMSTTTEVKVAVRYSLSQQSLLFKIRPSSFLAVGAELQWLSAFPGEAEVLYPPLTYLKPTGKTSTVDVDHEGQRISFTVVEVEPVLA